MVVGVVENWNQNMSKTARVLEELLSPPRAPIFNLSMVGLDGFLTAIVIGPELVRPSEWLPAIRAHEHAFENVEQAQEIMGALMNYYNGIIRALDGSPENYRPLYLPQDPAQQPSVARLSEWCQGFWKALQLDDWRDLIEDKDARNLLAPILSFVKDENGKNLCNFKPAKLEEALPDATKAIAGYIPLIREYWREQASPDSASKRSPSAHRNDPCPCGSGKKYKRCCASN